MNVGSTKPAGGATVSSSKIVSTAFESAPRRVPVGPTALVRKRLTVRSVFNTELLITATAKTKFVTPGPKFSVPLVGP